MRTASIIAFVTVFTLGASGGWAQPLGPPVGHGPLGPRLERLIKELGLDAATLAQVDAIIDASRLKTRPLRRQVREARHHMRRLLEAAAPEEAAVLEHVERIGSLQTALRKEQLKTMLRVRALLSPEQRATLLERLNQKRRHGRHGRHGRPRPEPRLSDEAPR